MIQNQTKASSINSDQFDFAKIRKAPRNGHEENKSKGEISAVIDNKSILANYK